MKTKLNPKILVLSTVHHYSDARIFFKEIPSIKKVSSDLVYVVKHQKQESFYENGIFIDPLPIPQNRFSRFFKLQFLSFKKIKKYEPDIVHFHDPELIILIWIIKKIFKCKIIFDIHESIADSFAGKPWIPEYIKPILPKMYSFIEALFIRSFDTIIVVKDSFKELYGNEAHVIMNYPLISVNEDLKKNFNENINFIYAGIIMRDRGFPKILVIFNKLSKKHDNIHFNLIGKIDTKDLEENIVNYIQNNNLNDKITLYGLLPINEVYKILEKSHIGISLMEPNHAYLNALTTKIFDYMANGVPYVVSNFEIYHEYTNVNYTGITVDYYNEDEILSKINDLLLNREKLSLMSANGIKNVNENWNWNTQEKKLIEIYNNLLESI